MVLPFAGGSECAAARGSSEQERMRIHTQEVEGKREKESHTTDATCTVSTVEGERGTVGVLINRSTVVIEDPCQDEFGVLQLSSTWSRLRRLSREEEEAR